MGLKPLITSRGVMSLAGARPRVPCLLVPLNFAPDRQGLRIPRRIEAISWGGRPSLEQTATDPRPSRCHPPSQAGVIGGVDQPSRRYNPSTSLSRRCPFLTRRLALEVSVARSHQPIAGAGTPGLCQVPHFFLIRANPYRAATCRMFGFLRSSFPCFLGQGNNDSIS